jgi:hypothetical protein
VQEVFLDQYKEAIMRRRDLIKKSTVPPSLAALRELIPKYIDLLQPYPITR